MESSNVSKEASKPPRADLEAQARIEWQRLHDSEHPNLKSTRSRLQKLYGLDRLRNRCTLSAIFHSDSDSYRTRYPLSVLQAKQEIFDWIDSDDKSASVLWVYGSAASGKTTLARTLLDDSEKRGTLAASFFFQKETEAYRDGNALVPTLAYQLALVFPHAQSHIKATVEQDPSILDKSRHTQFEHLFIEALYTKSTWPSLQLIGRSLALLSRVVKPRLVVIDALDECQGPEVQCDLIRLITSAIPRLASPLRFLIISRPELHIKQVFDGNKTLRRIDLDQDSNARYPIHLFLDNKLKRIHLQNLHIYPLFPNPSWLSGDSIATIFERSTPQFIYAATVIEYIDSLEYIPNESLEVILRNGIAKGDKPHARLDNLYAEIFSAVDEDNRDTVCCLFGILFLSTQEGYRHPQPSPKELEEIFDMRNGESIKNLLDPLLSLIALPEDPNGQIRILHNALFDYLLEPSRSGVYHVDLQRSRELLLRHYFLKNHT